MSEVKSKWIVVLAWKSFPMIGPPCNREEAEAFARGIWPYLMGVE